MSLFLLLFAQEETPSIGQQIALNTCEPVRDHDSGNFHSESEDFPSKRWRWSRLQAFIYPTVSLDAE